MFRGLATRLHLALLAVAVVAMLVAVPTGLGAKPVRTTVTPEPFVIPAGVGCPFDILAVPNGHSTITEFSDGRIVTIGHGEPTLTNLDTGTSYVQRSRYHVTDTFDFDANVLHQVISGRVFVTFWEGDQGPFGEVGENGAAYAFEGTLSITMDLDTFVYTSFSNAGTVTDLCAVLSA